jgi:hypothetical protein
LNSFFALQISLTCQKRRSIRLLPGARLFVISSYCAFLFDYSNVEETTSLPSVYDPQDTVKPLWEERTLTLNPSTVSSPYFYSGTTVRFVIRGESGIYGLTFDYSPNPYSAEPPARAVKLMDFPPVAPDDGFTFIFFGSSSAVILDCQLETYLIRYSWPDNDNSVIPASWLRTERTLGNCMYGLSVDVESGRVVAVACGELAKEDPLCHHVVWELSLIYKSES